MALHELAARRGTAPALVRPPAAWRELLLLVLLYVGYSAARMLGDADLGTATAHAEALMDVERALHLDVERWTNQALHGVPLLPVLASYWYAALHYLVTPVVLIHAYRSAPHLYRQVRNTLVAGSALGLVGFTLLPMAPPRMLPGYVDTLAATAGSGWWGSDASAPKGLGAMTNELAAMPSLHVGWALWSTWVVLLLTRNQQLRRLAVTYSVVTTVVVVATANHYVLDAVAGLAVMLVGRHAATRWADRDRRPLAVSPAPAGRRSLAPAESSAGSLTRLDRAA